VGRLILRAHIGSVALVVPLLVRVLPLRWVLRVMTPPRGWLPYRGVATGALCEAVRRRLARPRLMRRRPCLREGLMIFHFLSLTGHEPEMHFAVFPPESPPRQIHAHCWVTLDGVECSAPPQGQVAEMMRYARATGARPAGRP
jgi:hypothetical protein